MSYGIDEVDLIFDDLNEKSEKTMKKGLYFSLRDALMRVSKFFNGGGIHVRKREFLHHPGNKAAH